MIVPYSGYRVELEEMVFGSPVATMGQSVAMHGLAPFSTTRNVVH